MKKVHFLAIALFCLGVSATSLMILSSRSESSYDKVAKLLNAFERDIRGALELQRPTNLLQKIDLAQQQLGDLKAPTPLPPLDAKTAPAVAAIRNADQARSQRIISIEKELRDVRTGAQQLSAQIDAVGKRLEDGLRDLEIKVLGILRPKEEKGGLSIETLVALAGMVCTFLTVFLAFRKDEREREELQQKLLEASRKVSPLESVT